MNYDQSISELEKISAIINDPKTSLEDAILNFESSVKIAKDCMDKLKETSGKITVLKKELNSLVEVPFDEE